jgi:hypothetical protein
LVVGLSLKSASPFAGIFSSGALLPEILER